MEKGKPNVLFQRVIGQLDGWKDWRDNYNYFVPLFIEEASVKERWEDWKEDVFREFFERTGGQCVSSLQQGYFTNAEKEEIKKDWGRVGPLLKRIAGQQDEPDFEAYYELKRVIREHTGLDRRAATNRLVAGLQPKLLCTVVNELCLYRLFEYLSCNVGANLKYVGGDWFRSSYRLWQFYQEQLPGLPYTEIMTLPWETYEYFRSGGRVPEARDMSEDVVVSEVLDLLEENHQVILQGAPGTGKTYVAKQVARILAGPGRLVKPECIGRGMVEELLHVGDKVKSVSGYTEYTIVNMEGGKIVVSGPDMATDKEVGIDKVVLAYQGKKWSPGKIVNGLDSYEAALALAVYERAECVEEDERVRRVQLVQFHPAYTYEDFVRGVSVVPGDCGLEYRACDRVLGRLAKEARKNLEDSRKDVEEVSKELWLDEQFDGFADRISEKVEQPDGFPLTDCVRVVAVEPDAFRYTGHNWESGANRMLFSDLKRAYLDGNKERQDLKHNGNLSSRARWHASYYVRMLDALRDYLPEYPGDRLGKTEKVEPQKFVLIVDEINRANLPAVLGELIYALEYRDEGVDCMYAVEDDGRLVLPSNLYVIGTMNTADRSVGQVDYAVRRRFAFVDMLPRVLPEGNDFDTELFKRVSGLFIEDAEGYVRSLEEGTDFVLRRSGYLSEDFRPEDVWLGHSYFIMKGRRRERRLRYEIKPILKEYVRDGVLKDKDGAHPVMDYIDKL